MSRYITKEPLAFRHVSPGSPQRNVKPSSFHSTVLAAFDEEFARLQQVEDIGRSTACRTMQMALSPYGTLNVNNGPSMFPVKKVQGEVPNLPLYSYKMSSPTPIRVYIRDEAEADEQVSKLQGCDAVVALS